ncbi:alpha/beta fold hydrolase [Streptomyces sp. NEAU-YJ-81]|uniref:alpha/beta fold hydrolase n=1 Tax=Streptomyces sp. NEAU-YJ-81 TaxID=2820288 RepID=UPI001ABC30E0|nr:alpha/beta hydrolase [Streptomyces sp. NEAU-YJ-81]MBO3675098.1 alpha/beta hydrolase [Streptomyces sp. NEAU-YJ-81]
MDTSIRKINRLIAALAAVLLVSLGASAGAWGDSRGQDAAVEKSPSSSSFPQEEPPPGFKSKYAEVNGFRMHYLQGGKGSPVVLIHGFPQSWVEWRDQMGPLSKNHTVIAVDLRGAGNSEVTKGGYEKAQMARDVHELLKRLKLNNGVQVVGHDVGLWVSYAYAAQWPREVRRMAVMEAPIPDDSLYRFPALEANPKTPSMWHFGLFQLPLAEHLISGHERVFVQGFIEELLVNKAAFTPADYNFYAHYLKEPGRTVAWMKMYRELRGDVDQNKKFLAEGKLKMPVLAIGGQASFGGKIADQWRDYATNVSGRVLKGAGHWVTEEKPKDVTNLLQSFLQK